MGDQAARRVDPTLGSGQWPPGGYPQGGGSQGGTPVPADRRHDAEGG